MPLVTYTTRPSASHVTPNQRHTDTVAVFQLSFSRQLAPPADWYSADSTETSAVLTAVHCAVPPTLELPAGQGVPAADTDPTAHWLPAAAMHTPEHSGVLRPNSSPYTPAGHGKHAAWPATLKVPGRHSKSAVTSTMPPGHAEPAGQTVVDVDTEP